MLMLAEQSILQHILGQVTWVAFELIEINYMPAQIGQTRVFLKKMTALISVVSAVVFLVRDKNFKSSD